MMNETQMNVATMILESFEGETRELPEGFVRLAVCVSCPDDAAGDALFNVAVDYLLELGALKPSVSGRPGNYFATLQAA
jgi:hypothetical protein